MRTGFFPPSKRKGLIVHGILLITLAIVSAWGFWNLSTAGAGPQFVFFLLLGTLAFAPLPLLSYRAYALFRAQYVLDRDSLELRWGLRDETIPLAEIEWVRSVHDLTQSLDGPALSLPGAVLGLRRHPDLGIVEFLASAQESLVLVATPKRVYAISPADPAKFIQTFSRAVELGSLRPAKPRSLYPSFIVARAWQSGLVRYLWLAALFLNLGLVVWVSLLIPASARFALGLQPDRTPAAVPSVQIVILPLLSVLLNLLGWATGLFFYRWAKWKVLAVLVWGSGTLASALFLIAVLFIVMTPV